MIAAKQINAPQGAFVKANSAFTILTGTSAYTTTSSFGGRSGGGNDTTVGVFTAAPNNIVTLSRRLTGAEVVNAAGLRIYGRNTFAATVFTTTLYVSDGAGGETVYSPVAGDNLNNVVVDMRWCEAVAFGTSKPTDIVNGLEFINELGGSDPNSHVRTFQSFGAATAAQTSFTLSATPKAGSVSMFVNGEQLELTREYTVAGTTVTYLATDYALATTDRVWAWYDV